MPAPIWRELWQNFRQIRLVRHHDPRQLEEVVFGGGRAGIHDGARRVAGGLRGVAHGLVLHGHMHERTQHIHVTSHGTLHSIGATSASLHHRDEARMSGFNLYEMSDEGAVLRIEAHVFDPVHETFSRREIPQKRLFV